MTKNEYIASIMLEAAELLKSDDTNNDNMEYDLNNLLTEAAEYDGSMYYLNEAVDELKEINSIKKEIKNSKDIDDKKMSAKIKNIINNTLKWYYKIEPNKKLKALHTVLRILNKLINLTLGFLSGSLGVMSGQRALSVIHSATGLRLNLGYNIRNFINFTLITLIPTALIVLRKSIKQYSNIKFNISDYDNNVKEIQSQIDIIDKQIEKGDSKQTNHLYKLRNEYSNMLEDLRNMKEKYDKKNK